MATVIATVNELVVFDAVKYPDRVKPFTPFRDASNPDKIVWGSKFTDKICDFDMLMFTRAGTRAYAMWAKFSHDLIVDQIVKFSEPYIMMQYATSVINRRVKEAEDFIAQPVGDPLPASDLKFNEHERSRYTHFIMYCDQFTDVLNDRPDLKDLYDYVKGLVDSQEVKNAKLSAFLDTLTDEQLMYINDAHAKFIIHDKILERSAASSK